MGKFIETNRGSLVNANHIAYAGYSSRSGWLLYGANGESLGEVAPDCDLESELSTRLIVPAEPGAYCVLLVDFLNEEPWFEEFGREPVIAWLVDEARSRPVSPTGIESNAEILSIKDGLVYTHGQSACTYAEWQAQTRNRGRILAEKRRSHGAAPAA